jgi:hypothetical protein
MLNHVACGPSGALCVLSHSETPDQPPEYANGLVEKK